MVASVNAAARKIYFTLVLHFFGRHISAACPKRARPCGTCPVHAFRLLVALLGGRDLLLLAKHLFVAARTTWSSSSAAAISVICCGLAHQCGLPDTADGAVRAVSASSEDVDVGAAHWRELAPLRRNLSARSRAALGS